MSRNYPKISIIMPSYNQGQFIEESIQSVINQNYPNLEFIIIDGDSNDNTVEIIKKYQNDITFWVSEKDNGQTHAINKGFKIATGDIITWLCSDDTYLSETLLTVGKHFRKNNSADFVYGNARAVNINGETIKEIRCLKFNILSFLARVNTIPQPASFYRKKILDTVGYLDESLYLGMDYDFFAKISLHGFKIQFLNKTLATYRYHANSKTVLGLDATNEHNETMNALRKKYIRLYNVSFTQLFFAKKYFFLLKKFKNIKQYWIFRKSYAKK